MIIASGLHHFARLELAEGVLKVREGTFRLSDSGIVSPQDVWVCGCLTEELGSLKHLALCLYALVNILDLLVQLMRLAVQGEYMLYVLRANADIPWLE